MKIVMVGGGSYRYLGIARSLLAQGNLLDQGEINLYDPAVHRAKAVGQMILKCPEYKRVNCKITWGTTLDEALDGADVVNVVLMAGNRANFQYLQLAARKHGFIGSDQLSPSGAMLALKGGPILMDIARRMEKHCPNAWLLDFANPVAVLSAAVNNHTKIKCLGVCAGYSNHQWDLTRLLLGKDEQRTDYTIYNAGVNHLSFILPSSTHQDQDLFAMAEEKLLDDQWQTCSLSDRWNQSTKANILNSIVTLRDYYIKYRQLVFSSEGDGLVHLDMAGRYAQACEKDTSTTKQQIDDRMQNIDLARSASDEQFRAWIDRDMDVEQWDNPSPDASYLRRVDQDLMVKIAAAVNSDEPISIATSFPNHGAVAGFTDRTVLEYSQLLCRQGLRPTGNLHVPAVFEGLISALASHQTLLGDAIATEDPRILFEALYSYPVMQDTAQSKAMWKELIELAANEIPKAFSQTVELLV
jgi:6-phospho-beta-glucosidase